MERLRSVRAFIKSNSLAATSPPTAEDFLSLWEFFDRETRTICGDISTKFRSEIAPLIPKLYNEAKLTPEIINKVRDLDLFKTVWEKNDKASFSRTQRSAAIIMEMAKNDASLATVFWLQLIVNMHTIEALGSEEQRRFFLPKMASLDVISGWGLTEPDIGSDAASVKTTATPTADGNFVLKGQKRWIGNGNNQINLIWAKNTQTKKVECFIVDNKLPNVKTEPIPRKLSVRIVQNCVITLDNVLVNKDAKLPGAKDFKNTVQMLMNSRVFVLWIAVGACIGIYNTCRNYVLKKIEAGENDFMQLIQQRLAHIMGTVNAVFLFAWRILTLYEKGSYQFGQISMAKAWISLKAREVARLGIDIVGGDDLTAADAIMKGLLDLETVYTYEGTYDINSLVAARDLTGLSAIK